MRAGSGPCADRVAATMKTQDCATTGCGQPAAFVSRSKPAWCTDCIDGILHTGGLEPAEPFTTPAAWRLTTCRTCGVRAHYRLDYVVRKNASRTPTCRACHWTKRANKTRSHPWMEFDRTMLELLRHHSPEQILHAHPQPEVREFLEQRWWPHERIASHLAEHGYDLVDPIGEVHDNNDPVLARCRRCHRISAAQMADFSSGCTCARNTRASDPSRPRPGRALLAESQSPALDWWDHDHNEATAFDTVTVLATRSCHWRCPECGLRFEEKVNVMTSRPACRACSARRSEEWEVERTRWKTTPVADVPELAAAWADDDDPREVMVDESGKLRRFRCPNGHHPRIRTLRFLTSGCPHCRGSATSKKWLADLLPEIAAQWHPTRNGKYAPQNVVWESQREMWWRADCCGHEWQESVRARDGGSRLRCPVCRTILGSLAWHDPGLAAEWSPTNAVTAWHVRPHASLAFVPEWVCATDPAHVWRAPLSSRSNGAECPDCRQAGKSRVELEHYAAAVEVFGNARSGITMTDDAYTTRSSWTTDISVDHEGLTVVIEYDGAYWHSADAKVLVDQRKSRDLLAAGCVVVRLREDDLPSLAIDHPRYREVRVHSTMPRPRKVIADIHDWVRGLKSHR